MSESKKKIGLPTKRRMRHDRHFVDELTHRMGEGGLGRMVRTSSITSNQDQPRTSLGDLEDLASSIAKHGVLEPLLVRRKIDSPGYELISGERRFHAAIEAGLTEVPCIELTVTDHQALEIALVENLQRQDLSPLEEADGFATLATKYGYTHDQIAAAIGRSRVTVTESLKLLALPQGIRDLCRHADITAKGILLEIARMPDEESMAELVQQIVEERLDRAAVRARRQEFLGEDDPADESPPEPGDDSGAALPAGGPSETPPRRPFVMRFKAPDRPFTVSLSFRTEQQPDTRAVIDALETLLVELRESVEQQPADGAARETATG